MCDKCKCKEVTIEEKLRKTLKYRMYSLKYIQEIAELFLSDAIRICNEACEKQKKICAETWGDLQDPSGDDQYNAIINAPKPTWKE